MSLRINHNTSSLNAHRNLTQASDRVSKSLEKLSSGLSINRAGDAPASLVASEQMRSQIASIEQAVKNSEASVSMVQTAEGALTEVNNLLVGMRQLSIHAANEGANDMVMLEADQTEISGGISAIDRIAQTTSFGSKKLLDGSNGVSGTSIGAGLSFVEAGTKAMSSGKDGYDVVITQESSAASWSGSTALTKEMVEAGETLTLVEGGKSATYTTKSTDTVASAIKNFAEVSRKSGLAVDVTSDDSGVIRIAHKQHGSQYTFQVSSSTAGVLSQEAGSLSSANSGTDLMGTINGEATLGKGDTMTGLVGNPSTDNLTVRYRRPEGVQPLAEGTNVGKVTVAQNALTFQVGPDAGQTVEIALQNMSANQVGRGIANSSAFESLADIDVRTAQGAQDALKIIDTAINDVSQTRSRLGSFQKNTLATNIATLRTTQENMVAAESTIRDTDIALEMANYTRNELMKQSAAAMMSQANSSPSKVFSLLMDR
ncbi:MAG: flagellin [bacterium]|nr:flagellin [bacterium]